jgi:hypothetical protein
VLLLAAILLTREGALHIDVRTSFDKRWIYFSVIAFGGLFKEAGLTVGSIDHGYGGGRPAHRRIFHAGIDRRAW